jgi:excisionase family DNA binding protein
MDDVPLYVRLPVAEARRLERAAASSGQSKRRLVSDAVRAHLDDDGPVVGRIALREEPDDVLSADQVAAWLKVDPDAVVAAAAGGELPGRCIGGAWRFSRRAVVAWLEAAPAPRA